MLAFIFKENIVSKKFHRNLILHLNRYQERIIYPVLISCLIACTSAIFCLAYIYFPEEEIIFKTFQMKDLKSIVPWILVILSLSVMVIVFWAYYISNKIVGPIERVLKELDDVISGKRTEPLGTRKGDEMFDELVKRINALIKK